MAKRWSAILVLVGFLGMVSGVAMAADAAALNDAVLFFVNDPQQLTFCDMNKLVEANKTYHQEHGLVNDANIQTFYQKIMEHGVVNPGPDNKVQVGYVVQNQGADVIGVLVVKGKFEHEKVLDTLKKHYGVHSNEHAAAVMAQDKFSSAQKEKAQNPYTQADMTINGQQAHVFPMPLDNRELICVTTGDYTLFSSGPRGNRKLLTQTLDVVTGKLAAKPADANTKVVLTFSASPAEKKQLEERAWVRYDAQKKDSLSQKKFLKKSAERIRQRVIRNKIEYMFTAIEDMQQATMTIERGREGNMTKNATLIATFKSPAEAADVKARLMKHMVKEIKRNDNVQDKFALGNVSITTAGNQCQIKCNLRDAKEQMHAFNLISSYVAKGMFDRL